MEFHKILTNWYLKKSRDLPWRKNQNPYHVWLSEIMLQQTRVAQGLPYFLKFTEAFPTIFDLANSEESKVLKLWQGLGYYSRARNLHFTAKVIANELNGQFPDNYKDLLKLKGVGDYTASAIASICFNKPNAVVDGNVYRVLSRYFGIATPINSTKGMKEFKELAQTLIDTEQPGIYNQAIMEFGALHCKPKNPLCNECPLQDSCVGLEKKRITELPVKEKKIKVKKRFFNYVVIVTKNNKTIMQERTQKGIWQNLHEFPLVETTHSIDEKELVLNNQFNEICPFETTISLHNTTDITHKLSHQHLFTKFWIVKTETNENDAITWKKAKELPVPVLISNFIQDYLSRKN